MPRVACEPVEGEEGGQLEAPSSQFLYGDVKEVSGIVHRESCVCHSLCCYPARLFVEDLHAQILSDGVPVALT